MIIELLISNEAAEWYKHELELKDNSHIRFFPRYGSGGRIPGFSIGMTIEEPQETYASSKKEGITFYIEEQDAWYFEGVHLIIELDESRNEPIYNEKA